MFVNCNEIPVHLDEFLDTPHINKGDSNVSPKLHLQSHGSTRFDLRGRIAWMKVAMFRDSITQTKTNVPF